MERKEIRAILWEVTKELINGGNLLNTENRAKFAQIEDEITNALNIESASSGLASVGPCFPKNTQNLSKNQNWPANGSPSSLRINESQNIKELPDKPDDGNAVAINENLVADITEGQINKWEKLFRFLNKHGSLKDFAKTKVIDWKCVSSKKLQKDDVICFLVGKVIPMDEGLTKYNVIGNNYLGTFLFNLGKQFDFKWFSTDPKSNSAKTNFVQKDLPNNCNIFVLTVNQQPVPVIFTIQQIQENQPLSLSLDYIEKLNNEFFSLDEASTKNETIRKSSRIPNLSDFLEDLYEMHLGNKTADGVEKKFVSHQIGSGLFASKIYLPKQFIIEYQGKLLSEEDGKHRFDTLPKEDGSFFFFLGKSYNNQWVDATENKEALARFVNHSKANSNAKVICRSTHGRPRIFLVATRTIQIGEQLFYDYNERDKDFPFLYR